MKNNVFVTGKGRSTCKSRTICEVHRGIYDECFLAMHESDPDTLERITVLLNEAFGMGVRMDRKLTAGRDNPESELEPNTDIDRIRAIRQRRIDIHERILRNP